MSFINWSDSHEMLGLLSEFVVDERHDSTDDPARARFLTGVLDKLSELQVATLAKTHPTEVHPLVAVLLVSYVANGIVTWKYFFALPVVMSAAISICLALSLVLAKRGALAPNKAFKPSPR